MSRAYCCACQLPQVACLCAHVYPQPCPLPVLIIQHPLEAKHAKSTVPLLRLALPDLDIVVAEQLSAPKILATGQWWLLYPDAHALDLDTLAQDAKAWQHTRATIGGLIILDGTWRKTRLLLHLNPWLRHLPTLSFSQAPSSGYAIRKGPGGQALSTLESVAHVLQHLAPGFCAAPLHDLLAARVAQFKTRAPSSACSDQPRRKS
ncbi:hypothetical protein CBP12_07520 [Oceanisphaera avium]|uniref:tRNA-uridine aminocarboxypropyltransferase n=2 Tax=Oceanisphaera avium TaxID=1903694 RepID=A0A1Y0D0M3_9GAMM|nr:hypothetical protein CBP12_07520 [Oceanisphaera avium]